MIFFWQSFLIGWIFRKIKNEKLKIKIIPIIFSDVYKIFFVLYFGIFLKTKINNVIKILTANVEMIDNSFVGNFIIPQR